jgi:hypothetical protein
MKTERRVNPTRWSRSCQVSDPFRVDKQHLISKSIIAIPICSGAQYAEVHKWLHTVQTLALDCSRAPKLTCRALHGNCPDPSLDFCFRCRNLTDPPSEERRTGYVSGMICISFMFAIFAESKWIMSVCFMYLHLFNFCLSAAQLTQRKFPLHAAVMTAVELMDTGWKLGYAGDHRIRQLNSNPVNQFDHPCLSPMYNVYSI